MSLTAFVFARGGSKGLPGKNLRKLAGKPLIGWAVEHALGVERIDRVIVSTDSPDIADTALQFGAEVPFLRPAELASDNAPELLAWRHAMEFLENAEGSIPSPFISVPTTAPLRLPSDINSCLDEYDRSGADVVLSICPSNRSPWFNMVTRRDDGQIRLISQPGDGEIGFARRQDAPPSYDIVPAAYVVRPSYVFEHLSLFEGHTSAAILPAERGVDIDTLLDFEFAEFLMKKTSRKTIKAN